MATHWYGCVFNSCFLALLFLQQNNKLFKTGLFFLLTETHPKEKRGEAIIYILHPAYKLTITIYYNYNYNLCYICLFDVYWWSPIGVKIKTLGIHKINYFNLAYCCLNICNWICSWLGQGKAWLWSWTGHTSQLDKLGQCNWTKKNHQNIIIIAQIIALG